MVTDPFDPLDIGTPFDGAETQPETPDESTPETPDESPADVPVPAPSATTSVERGREPNLTNR